MTETLRIPIDSQTYVNVSEGHSNVSLIIREQNFRVIVGGETPSPDVDEYLKVSGRSDGRSMLLSITDLAPDDSVWVRYDSSGPDDPDTELRVVRGVAKVLFSS